MSAERYTLNFYKNFYQRALKRLLPDRDVDAGMITILAENSTAKSYEKKEFVIHQSEPQHYIYFVLSGAFRSFTMKDNGSEATNNFMFRPGEPFIVALRFEEGAESIDNVQAMERGELIMLSLTTLRELQEKVPWVNFLIIQMLSDSFEEYHTILKVRTWRAIERYRWLHETHPELEKRIQAQYLAQYLDVEKTVFSRVRNEYMAEQDEKNGRKTL